VSNRVSRRQAGRWAEQEQQQAPPPQAAPPPPPPPAAAPAPAGVSTEDKLAQLTQLGELKTAGVLTDAEFEAQKARILSS